MVGALVATAIVLVSLLIFGAYYFIDPLGKRTATRPQAQTEQRQTIVPDQTPITPMESQFAQYLYGPSIPPTLTSPPRAAPSPSQSAQPPTLTAILTSDKRAVTAEFGNLNGVTQISYFVTYIAKTGAQGINGSFEVPQPSAPIKRVIALGRCSKNVCVYDEITTPISVRVIYRMVDGRDVELTETIPY